MNYIYDILLNFKKEFFEFYEWNLNDDIINIRKIPVFKVRKNQLYDFKNCNLKLNQKFLKSIFNKSEIFKGRNKKSIKYSFLVGNNDDVLAIYLDDEGKILYKSDLLIDEYEDTLEVMNELDITDIEYETICTNSFDFKTRNEKEKICYIINHLYKTSEDKLKYLYYEFFDKKEENIDVIKNTIIKKIDNDFNFVNKVYDFYKLISYKTR